MRARAQGFLVVAGILLWPFATGCRRPRTATIAYSVGAYGTEAVRVARDALDSTARPGDPAIVIQYDSLASSDAPEVAIPQARRFLRITDLVGVVGPGGSRISLAVAPVYNDAHVTHIPPTATSRLLERAGPWTMLLAPNDSVEGDFIAAFVAETLHARRVDVFYQNDEYGDGLQAGVQAGLRRRGVTVLYGAPVDRATDFDAAVGAALADGAPDVVVSGSRGDETVAITAAFRRHGHPTAVVAGDGALTPRLADAAPDSVFVVSFWTAAATDPASQVFVRRFRRLLGRTPTGPEALNHDAIMVIAAAVRAVGPDPGAVHDWLLSLGRSRPAWPGVTGPIAFGAAGARRLVMTRLSPRPAAAP